MTQEGSPQIKSRLDTLVDKASKELAERVVLTPKAKELGVTQEALQEEAVRRLESHIGFIRERMRSSAQHIQEMGADGLKMIDEYKEHPHFEEIKRRYTAITEERVFRASEMMNETDHHAGAKVLESLGISENTAKEIVDELFTQESKVVAFTKK